MDLGGNFVDMSSQYQSAEPTSGYGAMEDINKPKRPKQGSGAKHAAGVRKRQQQGTNRAKRNIGNCRRGHNGQLICD